MCAIQYADIAQKFCLCNIFLIQFFQIHGLFLVNTRIGSGKSIEKALHTFPVLNDIKSKKWLTEQKDYLSKLKQNLLSVHLAV